MKWKELWTHVFLVNLPERFDRFQRSHKTLSEAGIQYELWDATSDANGVKGLCLSMKRLFRYILTTDIQNFIVFEDDCDFKLPINEFLDILAEQTPKDYDLVYLGCNLTSAPERYSENLLRIQTSYCTQAIAYNRKVVQTILDDLDKIEPYDTKLMKIVQSKGHCYCTYPMFCEQYEDYSDIEKRVMDWAAFQRQTYAAYTKSI
jgi:hypothetical protein